MTERLHFHFSLSCIGEGNGNPLQCSCLENPRDRGAWWAAVYGPAQSRTQLKRLSSSSSSSSTLTSSTMLLTSPSDFLMALCMSHTHPADEKGSLECVFSPVWLCNLMDCNLPGSSVHGISQARILEWATLSYSRGSSQCRNSTHISCVSCIEGEFFTIEPPGKPKKGNFNAHQNWTWTSPS